MLPAVHWLFVYGTLMPGRLRWPHVASLVAAQRPAAVAGTLYDTGHGYPALVLDRGGRVDGWLLGFAPAGAAEVMARLDEVEGPSYRQAPVTTADGTAAVTYEWVGPLGAMFTPLAGRWENEDER
jgi:gamma-glutamylcyclotransferase (GGCT)/AIG2-like uncharacterized protein YtfP